MSGSGGDAGALVTELRSVEAHERELRFTVSIAGRARELWLTSPAGIAAANEAAAVATLIPALAVGGPLRIEVPVAPAVIDAMNEAQAVLCGWAGSGAWPEALPFGEPIEISAPVGESGRLAAAEGVAAFFTGGVDSLATVLRHPEINHLIQVEGFDVALERVELEAKVRAGVEAAAVGLSRELLVMRTNLRELSDPHVPWVTYYGSALGTIALALSGRMSRVMIASGLVYGTLYENGSHPLLDRLWGADRVEIVHDGASLSRVEKLEILADDPVARGSLRVCWQNHDGAYNCGRCEKCLRTMVTLESLGVRDGFETFPDVLDLDAVAEIEPGNRPEVDFWLDNLRLAVREGADRELIQAIETCLGKGDGLPAAAREARRTPHDPDRGESALFMHPPGRRRLASARGVAFLVGSYEGWGNYGDLAQAQAALELLDARFPGVVACPVLSLHAAAGHAQRAGEEGALGEHTPLYFAEPGEGTDYLVSELGLVPAILPGPLSAVAWLYGGGYLNARWGVGKLRMLEAVRAIVSRAGGADCPLISSGLQIDPAWVRALDDRFSAPLCELRLLGVRDELSAQAIGALPGCEASVARTGDDAIGVLGPLVDGAQEREEAGSPAINVHFCAGEWVADDPGAMRDWSRELIVEIAAATGPIRIQPLIAYEDPRMSERPDLDQLCAEIGSRAPAATISTPLVLTPGTLPGAAATIAAARLTVSSSYHVALTSLMLGVPAVLPRANDYYAQKADALRRGFDLPESAFPDPREEPRSAARRALAALDPIARGRRPQLQDAAARALAVRADAEARVAAELDALLPDTPAVHNTASVTISGREQEALLGGLERAYARLAAASARSAWAEARLADITDSATWRMTGPIRAAKALLRRSIDRRSG